MACHLEVTCYTKFGETLVISGSDSSLGGWDLSRAVELHTDAEAFPIWSVYLRNMPPPGTEFKFVILLPYGRGVAWEDLACNRRWFPASLDRAAGEGGIVVSARFGEGGLRLDSSPEATVCAACPEEHQQEVAQICKANKIMKAFGHWPNKMDASWLAQAWREWEVQVLTAVVGLVNEREASSVHIVCIEGGPWASMQKAKQPDLLNAVRSELGDQSFPVNVVWMTLSSFRGEYKHRRGRTSVPSTPRQLAQVHQPVLAAADAAAGGGGIDKAMSLRLGQLSSLPSRHADATLAPAPGRKRLATQLPSTGSSQSSAFDILRLAEDLYGPGSDEATFIGKKFGGFSHLPLPKPDEGVNFYDLRPDQGEGDVALVADCKYFDLSPRRREDNPPNVNKKDIGIDSRLVSSRQPCFRESKHLQQSFQDAPTGYMGSAEERARSNSIPLGHSSRKSGGRHAGPDRERKGSVGLNAEQTKGEVVVPEAAGDVDGTVAGG